MATGNYAGSSGGGGAGSDTTAIHDDVAGEIAAITEKVSPIAADLVVIEDSAAGNAKKRVQLGNLPGSGAAPLSAEYVVVSLNGTLTGERRIQAEATVLALTDGGANGDLTVSVAANGITNAKLRQSGALAVVGRSANSTGNVADIQATAATGAVLRESGSVIGFGTIATAGIAANAVDNTIIRDSGALSVIGRSANSSGDPADISASAASGAVLRESGSTVGFGTVATAGLAANAVTDAILRQGTARTVVGRSANSTGNVADIAASATGQALTDNGTTLAWRLLEDIILADKQFEADQFENPTTADWSVNALAPIAADGVNSAVKVRLFDDTTDEGVGWSVMLPGSTTRFRLRFKSKAVTAPGAARTVGLSLRFRRMQDNTAVAAWVTHALTDIDITTNALFQDDTQAIAYSTPSTALVAGSYYQFELVRTNPTGGTELVGDWALKTLVFEALL